MVKHEWKHLFKNPLLILVLCVIILIPSIYAGFFLASMWDPYGELDKLPVAVVNLDKSVEYNDSTLSVGDDLVKELKENDSLDFHFVDQQTAEQGLKDGNYYCVITIPEEFSENASTLMDDDPQTMELSYETNPATNYVAMKLSESAVTKIELNLQEEVTKTYAKSMFAQLHEVGDGMQDAADGADELLDSENEVVDGVSDLKSGSDELTDGVSSINSSAATLANGVKSLDSTLNTAMTAYMMSVGLWVGALAFCLLYPLTQHKKLSEVPGGVHGLRWWFSKSTILYPMAIVMGMILIWILHTALGLDPARMEETIFAACLTACAFMAIQYFFNAMLGEIGSFLMLVFMVLNLAGSAGTYPLELSGPLANALHVFMPFTYTVTAFRSTIGGGTDVTNCYIYLTAMTVIFSVLTVILFMIRAKEEKAAKHSLHEWLEKCNFA